MKNSKDKVSSKSPKDTEALFTKSLEYVLRAPKTERQVRDWLFKKRKEGEFLPVDEIINKLKERGYINDAEYAKNFTSTKQTKIGTMAIKQKLIQKGIARDSVDTAVSEIGDEEQTELARSLAKKYMRGKNPDQKTLQKLYRYLLSKGLKYDIISTVVTGLEERFEDDWD